MSRCLASTNHQRPWYCRFYTSFYDSMFFYEGGFWLILSSEFWEMMKIQFMVPNVCLVTTLHQLSVEYHEYFHFVEIITWYIQFVVGGGGGGGVVLRNNTVVYLSLGVKNTESNHILSMVSTSLNIYNPTFRKPVTALWRHVGGAWHIALFLTVILAICL